MFINNAAFRYKTPYNGPFDIMQSWTNGMVTLHCGVIKRGHNIRCINPCTYDTNVENIKC